jgi:hypothetical protein
MQKTSYRMFVTLQMLCTTVLDHISGRSKSKQPSGSNLVFAIFATSMQNLEGKWRRTVFHIFPVNPNSLGERIRQIPTVLPEISLSWRAVVAPLQELVCFAVERPWERQHVNRKYTWVCASSSLTRSPSNTRIDDFQLCILSQLSVTNYSKRQVLKFSKGCVCPMQVNPSE